MHVCLLYKLVHVIRDVCRLAIVKFKHWSYSNVTRNSRYVGTPRQMVIVAYLCLYVAFFALGTLHHAYIVCHTWPTVIYAFINLCCTVSSTFVQTGPLLSRVKFTDADVVAIQSNCCDTLALG